MKTITLILISLLAGQFNLSFAQQEHDHSAMQQQQAEPDPQTLRFDKGITLQQLEELALQNNPTVAQARAALQAAQGRLQQAGLFPNPTVGYMAEELAWRSEVDNSQHMFFVEQDIPLGGKLGKRKELSQAELRQAELLDEAQRNVLLNAVRALYFEVLGAQYEVAVRQRLADLGKEAVQITSELFNVGAADLPDHLEAEIEAEASQLAFEEAEIERQHLWIALVSITGKQDLQLQNVAGELSFSSLPDLNRESLLNDLLERSVHARSAQIQLERAEASVRLAKSGGIPDLNVRGGIGYNNEQFEPTFEDVGWQSFIEVGVTLPIFNRNQGNVAVAEASRERAKQEVSRIRLSLTSRFADAFAQYVNERRKAERYEKQMLPRARKAYDLYLKSFQQMGAAYPQVLISKRNLDQLEVEYIDSLKHASVLATQLQGSLLGTDALTAPSFTITEEPGDTANPQPHPEMLDLTGHED